MKKLVTLGVLLATLAAMAVVAVPAYAALPSDTLRSIGPSSASSYSPGDQLSIPFELAEPEAIDVIQLNYTSDFGDERHFRITRDGDQPIEEGLEKAVTGTWWPGQYQIESIYLEHSGPEWDYIAYSRNGNVYRLGSEGTPEHHDIDLSAADFTIVNDEVDIVAPVLDSVEVVSGSPHRFRDPVLVEWAAHDDSGIDYISFEFVDPQGRSHYAYDRPSEEHLSDPSASGVARGGIHLRWASGRSTLRSVWINSGGGDNVIQAYYQDDGSIGTSHEGAIHPATHDFDFSARSIDVDNAEWDIDEPVVKSLTRVTPETLYPGEQFSVAYEVEDAHSIVYVTLNYDTPGTGSQIGLGGSASKKSDTLTELVPDELGDYQASFFAAYDEAYNEAWLIDSDFADEYDPADRIRDFSDLDFTVAPWPHVFEDKLDRATLSFAFAQGRFRIEMDGQSTVLTGLEVHDGIGAAKVVRYDDGVTSLAGAFDPTSGAFAARLTAFGQTETLVSPGSTL
ncbi:MAG: hypothetical protein QOG54_734 [Actinomycetota bacterium]|nr:hypothetical protein [Actinomycetota bacterium]